MLGPEQEEYMREACNRESPKEACGIIADGRLFELENHASEPGTFHIRGSDIQALAFGLDGVRELDAVWHTHPSGDPHPSVDDVASHPWPASLIVATREIVTVYHSATEARSS